MSGGGGFCPITSRVSALIHHIVGDSAVLETPHFTRRCPLTIRCNKYLNMTWQ